MDLAYRFVTAFTLSIAVLSLASAGVALGQADEVRVEVVSLDA